MARGGTGSGHEITIRVYEQHPGSPGPCAVLSETHEHARATPMSGPTTLDLPCNCPAHRAEHA